MLLGKSKAIENYLRQRGNSQADGTYLAVEEDKLAGRKSREIKRVSPGVVHDLNGLDPSKFSVDEWGIMFDNIWAKEEKRLQYETLAKPLVREMRHIYDTETPMTKKQIDELEVMGSYVLAVAVEGLMNLTPEKAKTAVEMTVHSLKELSDKIMPEDVPKYTINTLGAYISAPDGVFKRGEHVNKELAHYVQGHVLTKVFENLSKDFGRDLTDEEMKHFKDKFKEPWEDCSYPDYLRHVEEVCSSVITDRFGYSPDIAGRFPIENVVLNGFEKMFKESNIVFGHLKA